ncbi:MAG TPA: hypothetical protein VF535_08495 [Allosphingosinicella sp.]|jgi:hypothetical protein
MSDGTVRQTDDLDAEIAACFRRADLKPSETPNTGFKLDHHYAATVAAGPIQAPRFKLPLSRPVYVVDQD